MMILVVFLFFPSCFILMNVLQFSSAQHHHAENETNYPMINYHLTGLGLSEETKHCMDIKRKLFHSTKAIDIQRLEWERFLPVFLKTQIFDLQKEKKPTGGLEMEFEHSDEHSRFHMLGPTGPRCNTPIESYGVGDDEKRACGLQQLQSINKVASADGKKHECVIYSIGCNGQWGFEEAIINSTNCRVETFDCTMPTTSKVPKALEGRVRLHFVCLSDSDYEVNGRRFVSWPTLNKITGVTNQPTFLKMDIEGYEFPVLKSIIDSGVMLPLQIAVEVHYIRFINGAWEGRRVNSMELYAFMNYIYKFGGYYLIDRHDNPFCLHCSEIVLAKLNCENYPRPDNYQELLLNPENPQDKRFEKAVKQSLNATYYS